MLSDHDQKLGCHGFEAVATTWSWFWHLDQGSGSRCFEARPTPLIRISTPWLGLSFHFLKKKRVRNIHLPYALTPLTRSSISGNLTGKHCSVLQLLYEDTVSLAHIDGSPLWMRSPIWPNKVHYVQSGQQLCILCNATVMSHGRASAVPRLGSLQTIPDSSRFGECEPW